LWQDSQDRKDILDRIAGIVLSGKFTLDMAKMTNCLKQKLNSWDRITWTGNVPDKKMGSCLDPKLPGTSLAVGQMQGQARPI
jgi:hypothetical protein